jgi:transcriptional regulator with XRE-family HTH domain
MKSPEILKLYREKMGFTQENLAKFLDIKREMISYFETGERAPSMDQYEKLAELYSIDIIDFFEENEELAKTNIAFAFRASQFEDEDLQKIAEFKKIIFNHLKLNQLKGEQA